MSKRWGIELQPGRIVIYVHREKRPWWLLGLVTLHRELTCWGDNITVPQARRVMQDAYQRAGGDRGYLDFCLVTMDEREQVQTERICRPGHRWEIADTG